MNDDQYMDVVMPDGTLVTGVPVGMSQDDVLKLYYPDAEKRRQAWQDNAARSAYGGALADKSAPARAFNAFGSGVNTFLTGARQRYNDLFGTEERGKEIEDEVGRSRLDATVAQNSVPGGAILGIAGQVAPTTLIPAGATASGTTLLGRTLLAMAAEGSIGALDGYLQPTVEGESVGQNVAQGALSSMVLPAALGGFQGARRMVTEGGGQERAGARVVDELSGPDATRAQRGATLTRTIEQLRNLPRGNSGIPLSSAAMLDNPDLARLERGSRTLNAGNWYDFDQTQARAVADNFLAATEDATQLGPRLSERSAGWTRDWQRANTGADLGRFAGDIAQFRNYLDSAMLQPEASNPTVRAMLKAINDDIDRVTNAGAQYTPSHLQQIRANLAEKYNPQNPNALSGAPRNSNARLGAMAQIDSILNNATNGRWDDVLSGYTDRSRLVDQSKAAGRVRESYYDRTTGRPLGMAADAGGDVPRITEAGLGRAINRGTDRAGNVLLAPAAVDRLNTVLDALRRQNIVQRVAKTATGGGGSNTASDQIASRAAAAAADTVFSGGALPTAEIARTGISNLRAFANTKRDRALAEALQNPDELLRTLEALQRSGQPMSPEHIALFNILQGSARGAASNY